jgi:hypothetical protein
VFDSVPSDAVGYVASAYLFFLFIVLFYIAILGAKFQRISRQLGELIDEIESEQTQPDGPVAAADNGQVAEPDDDADSPLREESSV